MLNMWCERVVCVEGEGGWIGVERRTLYCLFFFNDTATTEIYTLSLHDALPILGNLWNLQFLYRKHWNHPSLNREPLESSVPKHKNIGTTHF